MFGDTSTSAAGDDQVLRPVDAGEQGPAGDTAGGAGSEIREAIDAGVRTMIASIPLPADGPLSEADKKKIRDTTRAILVQFKVGLKQVAKELGPRCHESIV